MKKLIFLILFIFPLTGCSLLKIASSPFKPTVNTTPQQTITSKNKIICKGEYKLDEKGNITYCSSGYYNYSDNYEKKDRKLTWREKLGQFISNVSGYIFWFIVISIVLTFMGFGWLVSGIWSATFSVGSKAFRQIVVAIQKAKPASPTLIQELEKSTDSDVRKFITEYKLKNGIK